MLLSVQLLNESLLLVPMLSNVYGANSTGTARDRLILDIVLKAVGNTLGELLTREGRELLEMIVAQIVHQGIIPGTYSGDKAYQDTLSGVLASASSSGYSLANTRELHALTNLAFNATAHLHDAMYNPDGTIDYSVTRGLPLQLVSLLHGRVINRLTKGKSREEYATELQFGDSSTRMDQQLNDYVSEGVLDPSGTVYKRLRAQLLAFNTLELYGLQELLLLSDNPYGADWSLSYIESDASGNLRRGGKINRADFLKMSEVLQRAILLQNLNYLRSQDLIDENNNLYFRDATGNRVEIKVHTPDGLRAMRLSDLTLVGLSDPRLQTAIDNGNTVLGAVIDQTSRNAAELQLRNGSRSEYIFNREILKLIDDSLAQAKHISFLSSSTGISDLNLLEELAKAAGLGDLTDASSSGIQYTTARLKELQLLALNTNRSIEELLLERIKLVLILAEDFGGEQFVSGAFVSTLQTIINNESFNRLNNEGAALRTLEELSSSVLRSKLNAENLFGGFAIAEYILNDVGDLFVNEDKRKEMQSLLETGRSALRRGDREQAYIISLQLRAMADEVAGGQLSYYHIRLANKQYSDQDYLASVLSGLDLLVLDVLTRGVTEGNLDIYRSGNRLSADPRINTEVLEFINGNATDTQSSISTDSLFVQNGINSIALVGSYWLRVQRMEGAEKEREMRSQRYIAAETYINGLVLLLGVERPEELFALNKEGFASKITRDNISNVHSHITSFLLATHLNETSNIVRNILHRTGSDTTLIHELLSYISEYHNVYNRALQEGLDPNQAVNTWVQNELTPQLRKKYYSDADIGNVVSLSRRTLALGISPDKLAEFLTFAVTNTNTIVMGDNVKRLRWATYWQSIMNQSEEDTYNLSEFDLVVAGFYGDGSGLITESEALNLATTRHYRATKGNTNTSARIESAQAFESALHDLFTAVRNTDNPAYQGVLPDGINRGESFAGYVFRGLAVDEGGNFLLGDNKVNADVANRFWESEIKEGGILHLLGVSDTKEAKQEFIANFTARGALFLTEYLGTEFSMRVHRGTGTAYVILNTLALRLAAVENLRLQDMASVDLYKFTYGGNSTIETSEFAEVAAQFFPGAFTDTNVDSILTATGYASPQGNLTSKFIEELKLGSIIQPDSLSVGAFRTLLNKSGKDDATVQALLPVIIDSAYGKDTHRYLTMDLSNEQNEEIVKAANERRALLLRDGRFTGGVLQGLSIEDVKLLVTNGTLSLDTATRILMSLNDVQVDGDDTNLTPVEEILKNAGILAQDGSGVYRITEGWATGLTITEALNLLNEPAADGTGRTRAQVIQDTREDINTSDGDFVNAIKKAVLGMEDDLRAIRNHVVRDNSRAEGPSDQNQN